MHRFVFCGLKFAPIWVTWCLIINMCIMNGVRYIILELPLNVFNKEQCGEEMHDSRWNLVMGLKLNPSTHVGHGRNNAPKPRLITLIVSHKYCTFEF